MTHLYVHSYTPLAIRWLTQKAEGSLESFGRRNTYLAETMHMSETCTEEALFCFHLFQALVESGEVLAMKK